MSDRVSSRPTGGGTSRDPSNLGDVLLAILFGTIWGWCAVLVCRGHGANAAVLVAFALIAFVIGVLLTRFCQDQYMSWFVFWTMILVFLTSLDVFLGIPFINQFPQNQPKPGAPKNMPAENN